MNTLLCLCNGRGFYTFTGSHYLFAVICTGNVFQAYDFGRKGNLLRYGSIKPFEYDLKKITAPVFKFPEFNNLI